MTESTQLKTGNISVMESSICTDTKNYYLCQKQPQGQGHLSSALGALQPMESTILKIRKNNDLARNRPEWQCWVSAAWGAIKLMKSAIFDDTNIYWLCHSIKFPQSWVKSMRSFWLDFGLLNNFSSHWFVVQNYESNIIKTIILTVTSADATCILNCPLVVEYAAPHVNPSAQEVVAVSVPAENAHATVCSK